MSSRLQTVSSDEKTPRAPDLMISLAIAGVLATVYAATTSLWWTIDDAFHLHFLTDHPGLSYLSAPVWQTLPFRMLTPLLFLSLQIDLWLFGFSPAHFYVHQVTVIAIAGVTTFWLFRLWFDRISAFAGSLLVGLGTPVIAMAMQLMTRHYIEGWLLASLSSVLFVLSVRQSRIGWSLLSAALFLMSGLAKEIFVPLPIMFVLLPEGTIRKRLMALRPHVLALCFYIVWRRHMLGALIGGYGWNIYPSELPGLMLKLPLELGHALFATAAGWILAAFLVVGMLAALWSRHVAHVSAAIAIVVLPIVPVAKSIEPRYAFGLWIVLIVTGMIAIARFAFRSRLLIVFCVLALLIAVNFTVWRDSFAKAKRMSTEARAFMTLPADEALRNPAVPPAAMGEFLWMKSTQFKRTGGSWFYDDIFLCASQPARVWEYLPARGAIVDQTSRLADIRTRTCQPQGRPLHATFDYHEGILSWTFGPYETGTYRVIIGEGVQSFAVPRRDSFQLPGVSGLNVRVRYDDQAGWTAYSDVITLDFADRPRTRWERR